MTAPSLASPPGTAAGSRRKPARQRVAASARAVGIALVTLLFLFPLVWMVSASFKSTLQIIDPRYTLSFTPTLSNYLTVFEAQSFGQYILNSFLVGTGATLIALLLGVPAAYGIARYKIKSATTFVLMARVIPGVSLLVPWYLLFSQLRMVGTYGVLILTHIFVTLPLVIAIMSGFFEGLPEELEESAMIDGCTRLTAFLRITLPLAVPGIATSTILAFIFSWNNFLFALVLSNRNTRTLPVAIANFTSYASVDWGGLMAAAVVITVPVIIIALFAQRYVVAGLTSGATKG